MHLATESAVVKTICSTDSATDQSTANVSHRFEMFLISQLEHLCTPFRGQLRWL